MEATEDTASGTKQRLRRTAADQENLNDRVKPRA
jgi:hypothetical protein